MEFHAFCFALPHLLYLFLQEQGDLFLVGDSRNEEENNRLKKFLDNFEQVLRLEKKVHLILDDPTGNSYIQVRFGKFF